MVDTALLDTGCHILWAAALETPGPIETLVLHTDAKSITHLHTYKHVGTSTYTLKLYKH